MNIQVLHFKGCPHQEPTASLVPEVVIDMDVSAHIEEIAVNTQADTQRLRFLESPRPLHISGQSKKMGVR